MYNGIHDPERFSDGWDHLQQRSVSHLTKRKQLAPPGVHVPNRDEARLLRRIMSETGLTEAQVRERKKYRIMLTQAAKASHAVMPGRFREQSVLRQVLRDVLRKLKLPKEHPKVREALTVELEARRDSLPAYQLNSNLADHLIRTY